MLDSVVSFIRAQQMCRTALKTAERRFLLTPRYFCGHRPGLVAARRRADAGGARQARPKGNPDRAADRESHALCVTGNRLRDGRRTFCSTRQGEPNRNVIAHDSRQVSIRRIMSFDINSCDVISHCAAIVHRVVMPCNVKSL